MSEPIQPQDYVAQKVEGEEGCYLIKVRVLICKMCKHPLMPTNLGSMYGKTMPWLKPAIAQQLDRAGILLHNAVGTSDGGPICCICSQGEPIHECYLCKKKWYSGQLKESFGYPQDHLCLECYSTVPALKWDETVQELEEAHLYDFG